MILPGKNLNGKKDLSSMNPMKGNPLLRKPDSKSFMIMTIFMLPSRHLIQIRTVLITA
jgi:hypothetical protein